MKHNGQIPVKVQERNHISKERGDVRMFFFMDERTIVMYEAVMGGEMGQAVSCPSNKLPLMH